MSDDDMLDRSLTATAALVADRQVSPVELVEAALRRIELIDETNAYISVLADDALAVARASETMIAAGHRLGPLHGVPVALKDNIDVRDRPSTAGAKILADHRPAADATVVKRLRAAGAILVGKTNMHEFAWGGTSANPHYGSVTNPWDTTRMPGGSSGGSGVAVATRSCFAALGTDTGGSIRLPSALNGITGLRPTIGRVPNTGVVPLAWSMDTVGPMARTAADCAVVLTALAGHDADDAGSADRSAEDYSRDLALGVDGLRIGIIEGYSLHHVQPGVEKALRIALETLTDLGARTTEVSIADIEGNISAQLTVEAAEPSTYHQRWLRERPEDYGDDVRLLLEAGELLLATQYLQAQRYRALLRRQTLAALSRADVLVCPTLPFTATPLGEVMVEIIEGAPEDMLSAIMQFTGLPSLTGLPAISVPCGFDDAGLPIGVQLIGRPFAEATLLRIGAAFQSGTDFHTRVPPLVAPG
ncbi:amidase [Pseudonocardia broussonetiae]|uniref:Aspartyl/glutamyl-tRNA amidotransferase subunit A n=1 Tax=Pseudonocardia broussonetiae TaxID=2736640 RepID=A0A6M6JH40_9PSEU|nr:amidase [Pseudonocardia broussonetiae]QJY45711.1 aspartyl/glutamyl-tRNA amidotransferase subunit A [Pseudonocardia broussonetiae]